MSAAKEDQDYLEQDCLEMEQFASRVSWFTSQYGREGIMSYSIENIIGPPTSPGLYGDFASSAVLATYGPWWRRCPSARPVFAVSAPPQPPAEDFIDLEFEQAVYVLELVLYEAYHRGCLLRVWARWQRSDGSPRWYRLWSRSPDPGAGPPHVTQARLNLLLRPVRHLRLELDSSRLQYYAGLDGVLLRGWRRRPPVSCLLPPGVAPVRPLLARLGQLRQARAADPAELTGEAVPARLRLLRLLTEFWCEWEDSRERRHRQRSTGPARTTLLQLPEEILLRVLAALDLVSLSRTARTCRHLHRLATDRLLHAQVDLQPYWHLVDGRVLPFLTARAAALTRLDLSWCGNCGALPAALFCNLLAEVGDGLLSLRVDACDWFDGLCLEWTGLFCRGLEELSLRGCTAVSDEAFWSLQYLCAVRRLDLYRTAVTAAPLVAFISNASGLQHLGLGLCSRLQRLWQVCESLGSSCPDLRSLNLWKLPELPWSELRHLRHCSRLQELDMGWCRAAVPEAESPLLSSLLLNFPDLRKIFLTSLRMIQDGDLLLIARHCPHIQQLDILGASLVHPEAVESVLASCLELELLDVSFCCHISLDQVVRWRRAYPRVAIQKSC